MNTRIKSMRLAVVATLGVVVFMVASAQAQLPASKLTDNRISNRSEFRLDLSRFPARRQSLPLRHAGFSLMPARSASIKASAMTPVADGPNLQVLGSGMLGRLTKWTGLTSSNAFIGDSIIFESKSGLVGIGTDTPTSKLTVAGMIETTLGGLRFPDGTTQTTAAVSGLTSIFHDATLQGNGTNGSPLGVAVPLNLTGAVPVDTAESAVIKATNTAETGIGVTATGGNGTSNNNEGGIGVVVRAGSSNAFRGGRGVLVNGGEGAIGGEGVFAEGGTGVTGPGGAGVAAFGGIGHGAGNSGGVGIIGFRGQGMNGATDGPAGTFTGDVHIQGNLTKTMGTFKIDHPLDPENKYLYHSFVESPDMMNIYNGNAITDANGDAVIELPAYFEALNREFRYQLTAIGTFAQAIVADEIKGNRFTIKTNAAHVKVSWQVTGIRHDAYADRHRVKVEEDKSERERGFYLHPEVFNQPEQRGVEWARYPEMMRQIKETREKLKANRD